MEKSLPFIGDRTLPSIMIPGTHDSGSYEDPPIDEPWYKFARTIEKGLALTQDENIFDQLVYGIRYFDIRVGYYGGQIWIVHDNFRTGNRLLSVAQQVKYFLQMAKKEIVIFDFHRFVKGFDDKKIFNELFQIVMNELGNLITVKHRGYGITINELLNLNNRIIIGFDYG